MVKGGGLWVTLRAAAQAWSLWPTLRSGLSSRSSWAGLRAIVLAGPSPRNVLLGRHSYRPHSLQADQIPPYQIGERPYLIGD